MMDFVDSGGKINKNGKIGIHFLLKKENISLIKIS